MLRGSTGVDVPLSRGRRRVQSPCGAPTGRSVSVTKPNPIQTGTKVRCPLFCPFTYGGVQGTTEPPKLRKMGSIPSRRAEFENGSVAHLGERPPRTGKVECSNHFRSTNVHMGL